VRRDANARRWPGPEALAWCVASEAPEAGDDVLGGGVRQLPEEHFGELHFARSSAAASQLGESPGDKVVEGSPNAHGIVRGRLVRGKMERSSDDAVARIRGAGSRLQARGAG
jgi:hypothetical protein